MTPSLTSVAASALIALMAFAANSVFCRAALNPTADPALIDPSGFTILRLGSGALMLILLFQIKHLSRKRVNTKREPSQSNRGSWRGALALFVYALCFSYAYVELQTGMGALILFGSVQITMVLASVFAGQKLHPTELIGVLIAFAGFMYLVSPGLSAPPLLGSLIMSLSGIAWAAYTLIGRNSTSPFDDTTFNFLRTLPLVIIALLLSFNSLHITVNGALLAILSGTLASGAGYSIWYFALRGLSRTQAGVLQLTVPLFAALGGIIFVAEELNPRLLLSFMAIVFGILIVLLGKKISQTYFMSLKKKL